MVPAVWDDPDEGGRTKERRNDIARPWTDGEVRQDGACCLEPAALQPHRLALLLVGAVILTSGAWLLPDVVIAVPLLGLGCGLGVAAARGTGSRALLVALLLLGAVARLPVLPRDPVTSSDLWRYLWEGRVVAAGENPARVPPSSPRLAPLRDDAVWPLVSHGDIATIYPSMAQGLFFLADALGGTPLSWKSVLLLLELVAAGTLGAVCLRQKQSLIPVALWLWNPLLVAESSAAGHVDAGGASLLLLAVLGLRCNASIRGILALAASALVKPVAAPLLLLAARAHRKESMVIGLLAAASLAPLALGPPDPESVDVSDGDTLFRIDDRALLSGGRHRMLDGSPWPVPAPHADASRLIGRYALRLDDPGGAVTVVEFDASQWVRWGWDHLGYYIDGDTFVLWDRVHTGARVLRLGLSADRLSLSGKLVGAEIGGTPVVTKFGLDGGAASDDVYGIKVAESPLMAYRQYSGRWSNDLGVIHRVLRGILTRLGVQILGAVGVLVLLIAAVRRRWSWPTAALAFAAWTVALLPVLYPWYAIWLLPGAVLGQGRTRWVAAVAATAPLLHLWL